MRRRWPVVLLLAGALLLLASLYLPWQEISKTGNDIQGALVFPVLEIDGFSTNVGSTAALITLIAAIAAATAWFKPHLASPQFAGLCGLLAGYFAIAVGADARSLADQRIQNGAVPHHFAYGAYLGLAATIVILLAAVVLLRPLIAKRPSPTQAAALALPVGLLVAYLLPWERVTLLVQYTALGIDHPALAIAAALTLCLPVARIWRLGLAASGALFTGAAVSAITFPEERAYGAWLALGLAIALSAAAVVGTSRPRLPRRALVPAAVGALFLVALFLPWERTCYAMAFGPPYGRRCLQANGWYLPGSAAALLSLGVIVAIAAPRLLPMSALELAAGLALLVATLGFEIESGNGSLGVHLHLAYGAIIGFVAVALLFAIALTRSRPARFPLVRLAPIAACAGFLVIVVLPWWGVLSRHGDSTLRLGGLSWLTLAAALLAIRLSSIWMSRSRPEELAVLPLAMLALVAVVLIAARDQGISWGGGIVVGLCLLLALLGLAERREELGKPRIPDILRLDQL